MWRLEFVCSGSGTIEKELANWGLYIIGEGVALALGQGATVIREEVCVCVYVRSNVFIFRGVEFTLASLQQLSLQTVIIAVYTPTLLG